MDRIDSIATFIEVAERGSFAAAARHTRRSPAAVTRAVAELEGRLGVRLLNRTTRAVSVTEEGQRFLAGARGVLADLDEIERAAAGQGRAPRGELAVTAPLVFGRLHVLPIVTDFLAQFPEVSVRLALTDRPADLVEEGLDAAVRLGSLADTSAIATRVGAVRRVVVATPAYLKARGAPRKPGDLAAHDVVAFGGPARPQRWTFGKAGAEVAVTVVPRLAVTTAEAAIDAAKAGLGLTRLQSYQAAPSIADGTLMRLLRAYEGDDAPVHVCIPRAGTRRRSCAPSSTTQCHGCAAH